MPNKPKIDHETQLVLDLQKLEHDFVNSEAWKVIKQKFIQKIVDNSSLNRMQIAPNTLDMTLLRELTARSLLASIALQWLSEIEGDADSYQSNMDLLTKTETDNILKFFPEK
jgi:hypothetical protein